MQTSLKRLAMAGMFLLPLSAATLHAQTGSYTYSPTAEGSTITNTATASFTDINGNTYTAVTGSASVKVGFLAAEDPTVPASYTPASPSSGNIAVFTLKNMGNGIDSVTVSNVTAVGLSITKYNYNGTDYATLAALNAVIKLVSLAQGAQLPFPVNVYYSVNSSSGGATIPMILTQASVRTPAVTNTATTNILPPAVYGVTVGPDGATIANVPSNGAPAYSYTFTITNTGNTANTFTLSKAVTSNGVVVLGSLSTTSVPLAAGGSTTFTVSYTVNNLPGSTDKITVTGTGSAGGVSDPGDVTVSVSKAAITMAKSAWTSMSGGVLITNTTVDAIVPGTTFYYKLAVTNTAGAANAQGIVITDALPAQLTYVSSAGDVAGDWTITQSSGTVTATMTPAMTIAAGATRYIWVGVKISTVTVP